MTPEISCYVLKLDLVLALKFDQNLQKIARRAGGSRI